MKIFSYEESTLCSIAASDSSHTSTLTGHNALPPAAKHKHNVLHFYTNSPWLRLYDRRFHAVMHIPFCGVQHLCHAQHVVPAKAGRYKYWLTRTWNIHQLLLH